MHFNENIKLYYNKIHEIGFGINNMYKIEQFTIYIYLYRYPFHSIHNIYIYERTHLNSTVLEDSNRKQTKNKSINKG